MRQSSLQYFVYYARVHGVYYGRVGLWSRTGAKCKAATKDALQRILLLPRTVTDTELKSGHAWRLLGYALGL